MAKAVARAKKTPVRRPWSKDDVRLLKGMARKEPAAKIAKALKRTEGDPPKSEGHRHLAQHDAQKASAREKALTSHSHVVRNRETAL